MLICSCLALPSYAATYDGMLYYYFGGQLYPIMSFDDIVSKDYELIIGVEGYTNSNIDYDFVFPSRSINFRYIPYSSDSSLTFSSTSENGDTATSGTGGVSGGYNYSSHLLSLPISSFYTLRVTGRTSTVHTMKVSVDTSTSNAVFTFNCNCKGLHTEHLLYIDDKLYTSSFKDGFSIPLKTLDFGKHTYKVVGNYNNIFVGSPTVTVGEFSVDERIEVVDYVYDKYNQICKFKFDCNSPYDRIYVKTSNGDLFSTISDMIRLNVKGLHSGSSDYITFWFTNGDFKSKEFKYYYEIPPWDEVPSTPLFEYEISKDYKKVIVTRYYNSWENVNSFLINGVEVINQKTLEFDFVENGVIELNYDLANEVGHTTGIYKIKLGDIPKPKVISLSYSQGFLHYRVINNDFNYPIVLTLDGSTITLEDGSSEYDCSSLDYGKHTASISCNDSSKSISFTIFDYSNLNPDDALNVIKDNIYLFLDTLRGYGVYILICIIAFALVFLGGRWLWCLFKKWLKNNYGIDLDKSRKSSYRKSSYRKNSYRKSRSNNKGEYLIKSTGDGYLSNYGILYENKRDFENAQTAKRNGYMTSSKPRRYNNNNYKRKGRYK